jgi:MFS family permease
MIQSAPQGEFSRGWKVILAAGLGVGAGSTGLPFYTFGVFVGPMAAEFGWSRSEITLGSFFLSLGTFLLAPFMGALVDRIGARRIGIASLAGLSLGYILLTLIVSSKLTWYLAWFLVAILGSGTAAMVWTKIVVLWFTHARGLALAITLVGTGVAGAIGPVLVNMLILNYGWRGGFIGMAAATCIGVLPIVIGLFYPPPAADANLETDAGSTSQAASAFGLSFRAALRRADFWRLGIGFFLVSLGVAAGIVHLVPLMVDRGLTRESAASIAGFLGLSVISGRLACGYLVDRFNAPRIAAGFLLVPAFGSVALIFAGADPVLLMAGALAIGLAAGAEVDLIAFLASRQFGLIEFGSILGVQLSLFGAGAALGPFALGLIRDMTGGYETGLGIFAGLYVLGAALILGLGPALRPGAAHSSDPVAIEKSP